MQMSETKFVHARGEKSHFEKEHFSALFYRMQSYEINKRKQNSICFLNEPKES